MGTLRILSQYLSISISYPTTAADYSPTKVLNKNSSTNLPPCSSAEEDAVSMNL